MKKGDADTLPASPKLNSVKSGKKRKKMAHEKRIECFFRSKKSPSPSEVYSSPSLYGIDHKDVLYDRYIASRSTSKAFSNSLNLPKPRKKDGDKNLISINTKMSNQPKISLQSNQLNQPNKISKYLKRISPSKKSIEDFFYSSNSPSSFESSLDSSDRISFSPKNCRKFCLNKRNYKTKTSTPSLRIPDKRMLQFHTPKKSIARIMHPFDSIPMSNPRLRRALFTTPRERRVAATPYRTLDAPGLSDNFYQSLLDWSARDRVAVALSHSIYIYDTKSHNVTSLVENINEEDAVSSLSWGTHGDCLAMGFASGRLELWDSIVRRCVRKLGGHSARIGTACWRGKLLATGSKDRSILVRDPRDRSAVGVARLQNHKQEVCGLSWAPFGCSSLASGGNDNKLMVWDLASRNVVQEYKEHNAAVKAIGWSPHKVLHFNHDIS